MDFEELLLHCRNLPLVELALGRLKDGLPSSLVYHSAAHTEDVLEQVLLFASTDGLSLRECELLAIAAAFHDIGFLTRNTDNEVLGAESCEKEMLGHGGFSAEERKAVMTAILDTQVKMTPEGPRQVSTSKFSDYLLDADVSNLGRDDFLEKAELVRAEAGVTDTKKFLNGLVLFLGAQQWYSPAAQRLRSEGKVKNVEVLRKRMAASAA
jgi:predicted metal-dependent HD superfamily phosphohydrolase